MLFNSYEFIFLYAPIVIGGYFWLGKNKQRSHWANAWLALASFFFYAYWDARYLPLLLASIAANYIVSGFVMRYRKEKKSEAAKGAFLLGLCINAGLLGFFKYTDFLIENWNYVSGGGTSLLHIVLPLGISFFTITQMVYLVDCYEGVAKERNLVDYALFVSFFPHLLAGPILYHKAMMRQFGDEGLRRVNWDNIAMGLSLFILGLFKKVIIADRFVKYVDYGFGHTSELMLIQAWLTAISYMLQIYFDFSGYSDMAVGLARIMNLAIPINFNSPYRAYGIIDFWSRWHMSLTTTITNYLYTPMVMACKNITFAKSMRATFAAMLIAGIWHGAGWTYVLFGTLHGLGLVVNHVWKKWNLWMWRPLGYALTLLFVLATMVIFRSDNLHDAMNVLYAMVGGNGVAWPKKVVLWAQNCLGVSMAFGRITVYFPWKIFVLSVFLAARVPNSNELLKRISFRTVWAAAFSMLLGLSILFLSDESVFLYFQF